MPGIKSTQSDRHLVFIHNINCLFAVPRPEEIGLPFSSIVQSQNPLIFASAVHYSASDHPLVNYHTGTRRAEITCRGEYYTRRNLRGIDKMSILLFGRGLAPGTLMCLGDMTRIICMFNVAFK